MRKHRSVHHIHSTDIDTMRILYALLKKWGHDNYIYEEVDEFRDPYSGAWLSNVPKASIEYEITSYSRIFIRIKSWFKRHWLWSKYDKIQSLREKYKA